MSSRLRFDGVYSAPFMEHEVLGNADFYIRFFPDGTLRAAVSWDYSNPTTAYQCPEYEFVRLGDPDEDWFTGTYAMEAEGFRYRIMDGPFIYEHGRGMISPADGPGLSPSITLIPVERESLRYTFVPYRGTKFDKL